MDERKEPKVTERGVVIVDAALRKGPRKKLLFDIGIAKEVLTPSYQFRRWMNRNKAEARQVASNATRAARDNAPVIGALGVGALLYLGRRPISKWISQLRNRRNKTPTGD